MLRFDQAATVRAEYDNDKVCGFFAAVNIPVRSKATATLKTITGQASVYRLYILEVSTQIPQMQSYSLFHNKNNCRASERTTTYSEGITALH